MGPFRKRAARSVITGSGALCSRAMSLTRRVRPPTGSARHSHMARRRAWTRAASSAQLEVVVIVVMVVIISVGFGGVVGSGRLFVGLSPKT